MYEVARPFPGCQVILPFIVLIGDIETEQECTDIVTGIGVEIFIPDFDIGIVALDKPGSANSEIVEAAGIRHTVAFPGFP